MTPIYLCCRDRLSDLKLLVNWLEMAGQERIIFLDNASTYPPLLAYFEETPHEVVYLGENYGSRALWKAELVPDEDYAYSDPDILPIEECPLDFLDHFSGILHAQHQVPKVGFGLKIDDVELTPESRAVEEEWYVPWRKTGGGYRSYIDTTMALYRGGSQFSYDAIRTDAPYLARHLPWYRDISNLDEEHRYYLGRGGDERLGLALGS